jgi:murein tripeptide amidase MpaA
LTELQTNCPKDKVNFRVGTLCQSLGGINIPIAVVTAKRDETIISSYQKPIIFIVARSRPGDASSSHMLESIMRQLFDKSMHRLLTLIEVHIVPMANPDGVIAGNSRCALSGININKKAGDL